MLARDEEAAVPPIETKDELVAYLEAGNKPPADWRIGTEHEKFGFHTADLSPVPYEGPSGISALLQEMCNRFGWEPVHEGDNIIALKDPHCDLGGSISLTSRAGVGTWVEVRLQRAAAASSPGSAVTDLPLGSDPSRGLRRMG